MNATVLATLCLTGCSAKTENTTYTVPGWYYTRGEVITEDGNIWGYTANNEFADEEVVLDDAGHT